MFLDMEEDLFKLSDSLEAFNELEKCTDKAILAMRSSERLEVRAKALIKPANLSERQKFVVQAVTADISNGGCMILSSRAILPGDFYAISFDEALANVGTQIARCMRCRVVQDDVFEVGFRFLQNISLKDLV